MAVVCTSTWLTVPDYGPKAIHIFDGKVPLYQPNYEFRVWVNLWHGTYRICSHQRTCSEEPYVFSRTHKVHAFSKVPPLSLDIALRARRLREEDNYIRYVLGQTDALYKEDNETIRLALYKYPIEAIVADSFFRLR